MNCMICEWFSIKIVKSKMANMKMVYYDYIKLSLQNYVQRLWRQKRGHKNCVIEITLEFKKKSSNFCSSKTLPPQKIIYQNKMTLNQRNRLNKIK